MSEQVRCPYCLREIAPNSKFCKYCGAALKICPSCGTPNKSESLYCSKCGQDIKDLEVKAPIRKNESIEPVATTVTNKTPVIPTQGASLPVFTQPPPYYRFPPPPPYYPTNQFQQYMPQKSDQHYVPVKLSHPYNAIKPFGFFSKTMPSSNVIVESANALAYSLVLIAIGVVTLAIGLAFFQTILLPFIGIIWGVTLIFSAPFFGIYYVMSTWLYRAFEIKRTVSNLTILWNYIISNLWYSGITIMIIPLSLINSTAAITAAAIAAVLYLIILTFVPLKAYLADLVYVKAATIEKTKNEEKKKDEQEQQNQEPQSK